MKNAPFRFIVLVIAVFLIGGGAPVQAQGAFAHGAVVALQGTPHLWFADEHGVLHWGGDTRALAGKHIAWSNRVEVSLDQLRTLPVGDPWLSAGLLKDGDPIYLVKWETDWPQPQLLHIQSIKDVELFGINGSNYGKFVIEKNEWERRFGISAAGLQRGVLASAIAPATPIPHTRSWPSVSTIPLNTTHRFQHDGYTWEVTVLEVIRGDAVADMHSRSGRSASYRHPPSGQEHVAAEIRVKAVGSGKLGRDYGILGYWACTGSIGGRCYRSAFFDPFVLVMQSGEKGESEYGVVPFELDTLIGDIGLYAGESETGWKGWLIRKGQEVVLGLKLEREQNDINTYTALFAVR